VIKKKKEENFEGELEENQEEDAQEEVEVEDEPDQNYIG